MCQRDDFDGIGFPEHDHIWESPEDGSPGVEHVTWKLFGGQGNTVDNPVKLTEKSARHSFAVPLIPRDRCFGLLDRCRVNPDFAGTHRLSEIQKAAPRLIPPSRAMPI